MWRRGSALSRRAFASRSRIAVGAAASLAACVEYERRSWTQSSADDHERVKLPADQHRRLNPHLHHTSIHHNLSSSSEAAADPTTTALHSSSKCQCESAAHAPQAPEGISAQTRFARLARRNTIQKIESTSTRKSLKSRYKVDWALSLGEGAYGAVYMAKDRATKHKYALKKIGKRLTDDLSFQREMNALLHLREKGGHPNICSLSEHFDEGEFYYLILDLVSGGELFDHLIKLGAFSEADTARLIREVASALAFLHGIDVVHGDLKPENIMLSSQKSSDAVVKVVDFGCAVVHDETSVFEDSDGHLSTTIAYSPPEAFIPRDERDTLLPPHDMWALGIILYIMLTGVHPFDIYGNASDEEIEHRVKTRKTPPMKNSPITAHLSNSAIDLIEKLISWNPKDRLTANEMLNHPWVRGETARTDKMEDSDKKLSTYRVFKSRLESKIFSDMVEWSDCSDSNETSKKASLIERSFRSFDKQQKGFITASDLNTLHKGQETDNSSGSEGEADPLSLSGFSNLVAENMKNKFFPNGHIVYREGEVGNHMYFINSGSIEVTTNDGSTAQRRQGDFFGEGALLHPQQIRSATIRCVTPVHAIEISREYFEKYLASSESGLLLNLREKDKTRKRNRAKKILRLQHNLHPLELKKNEYLYKEGETGKSVFILEEGQVNVNVEKHTVLSLKPGDVCGEHSFLMNRPRNTSAICTSKQCKIQVLQADDFAALLNSSPGLKASMKEICLRREFQKALVKKTKKRFPRERDLRDAFDAADDEKSGVISVQNIRNMLRVMDESVTEEQISDVINVLDLDNSGVVSFEEFKQLFGVDENKAASI
eukprot:scaffold56656_cov50-Attheya_sp.AAC.3